MALITVILLSVFTLFAANIICQSIYIKDKIKNNIDKMIK